MILNDYTRTSIAVGFVALFVTTSVLFVLGGFPGLLFGVGAAIAWLLAPPVFAFTVGQAGVAAVTNAPYPPLIVLAELALVMLLVGNIQIPAAVQTWTIPALACTAIAAGAWITLSSSVTVAAGVVLAGLAASIYVVARYELLRTDQLTGEAANE